VGEGKPRCSRSSHGTRRGRKAKSSFDGRQKRGIHKKGLEKRARRASIAQPKLPRNQASQKELVAQRWWNRGMRKKTLEKRDDETIVKRALARRILSRVPAEPQEIATARPVLPEVTATGDFCQGLLARRRPEYRTRRKERRRTYVGKQACIPQHIKTRETLKASGAVPSQDR